MDEQSTEAITALRSLAHPLRVRMLSLLTAEAMSAADVARELEVSHANASYHLRLLADAGRIRVVGEQRIRGGVAKLYRYLPEQAPPAGASTSEDRLAWAEATHVEVVRRLNACHPASPAIDSDLETWVDPDVWRRAVDLLREAALLLHAEARPVGTPGTVRVSATTQAFVMGDEP